MFWRKYSEHNIPYKIFWAALPRQNALNINGPAEVFKQARSLAKHFMTTGHDLVILVRPCTDWRATTMYIWVFILLCPRALFSIQLFESSEMPLEFITSQKGKPQLIVNGHLFGFHQTLSNGSRSWKCIKCTVN